MVGAGFRFFLLFLFVFLEEQFQNFKKGKDSCERAADDVNNGFDVGQAGGRKLRLRESLD